MKKRLICFLKGHDLDKDRYIKDLTHFHDYRRYKNLTPDEFKKMQDNYPVPVCKRCK